MVYLTAFLRASLKLKETLNHQADKILQRTVEVQTSKKARSLTEKWIKSGAPIAVDIESHNNGKRGKPGLITIKDDSKNIYLFRTGLDNHLMVELKITFENPKVIKIMHGAGSDIRCLRQSGIQIQNIFDTSIEHIKIHPANGSIGLNELCSHYGLLGNPYKTKSRNTHMVLWPE